MIRNFTLGLVAAMALVPAESFAEGLHSASPRNHLFTGKIVPEGEFEFNGRMFKVAPVRKAPAIPSTRVSDVITEAPGIAQEYSKASGGYYYYGNYFSYMDADQACHINWDDEYAYIYDILLYSQTGSYVMGYREDDSLMVPTDQTVFETDMFEVRLGLLKTVIYKMENPDWEDGDDDDMKYLYGINFEYSEDYDLAEYAIGENGELTLVLPGGEKYEMPEFEDFEFVDPETMGFPYYSLGYYYTDDYTWTGDCDIYQVYEEFNYEKVTVPEGIAPITYSYINKDEMGVHVNVYRDGDDLYFEGMSLMAPEAVFKATIEERDGVMLACISENQYVGTDSDGFYNLLTRTAIYNASTGQYSPTPAETEATFILEFDGQGNITSIRSNDEAGVLIFNYASENLDPFDGFPNLVMKHQEKLSGTPQEATDVWCGDYTTFLGAQFMFFNISQISKEGTILDVNNLYYRIFVNGNLYEFKEETGENLKGEMITKYMGITEPTTMIPYTFSNNFDLWMDEFHLFYVGFYIDYSSIISLGVQVVYDAEGELSFSDVVTINVNGDDSVQMISSDVVSEEYYDLKGARVEKPGKGIFVKRSVKADGSVVSSKVMKR